MLGRDVADINVRLKAQIERLKRLNNSFETLADDAAQYGLNAVKIHLAAISQWRLFTKEFSEKNKELTNFYAELNKLDKESDHNAKFFRELNLTLTRLNRSHQFFVLLIEGAEQYIDGKSSTKDEATQRERRTYLADEIEKYIKIRDTHAECYARNKELFAAHRSRQPVPVPDQGSARVSSDEREPLLPKASKASCCLFAQCCGDASAGDEPGLDGRNYTIQRW